VHGAGRLTNRRAADGGATNRGAASRGALSEGGSDGGGVPGRGSESAGSASGVGSAGRAGGLQGRAVGASQKAASVALSGGGSLDTLVLLENGTDGRVGASQELGVLRVGETGITVGVNATNDGEELALSGVVAGGAEEGTEVEGVNTAIVVFVDGAVGGEGGVVVSNLKVAFEDVKTSLEINLLLEDIDERSLDVPREVVVASNTEGGAVQSQVSQQIIFAGKKHLEEVLEGETTILVGVEESHESVGLALGGGEVAVILKVGEELVGGNVAVFVTVNALESGVRGEVTDGAETCASGLKGALTVTNSDKQVLQSVLRFVAKHFQIVVVSTQDKSQISKGKTCRVAEFRWPHF